MDIFTDEELKAESQGPEVELTETPEQKAERERDEQGRFKAKETVEEPGAVVEGEGEEAKKGGTVPQGALHAEREKRKLSDAERDAAKAELAALREQLGAITKMREQVAARKPAELPAADDPAALEHLRSRLAENEQQLTRVTQHMDEQALGAQEMQQLSTFMNQAEARIRQEKPDYDKAIEYIMGARASELQLYGLSPVQIQQALMEESADVIRTAVTQGRDPAELAYQLAQARGYRPEAAAAATAEAKPQGGGGAAAMLDAIERARSASKSLGSGGGAAAKTLTAEAVASLSAEEFDAIYSTPEGKAMIDAL